MSEDRYLIFGAGIYQEMDMDGEQVLSMTVDLSGDAMRSSEVQTKDSSGEIIESTATGLSEQLRGTARGFDHGEDQYTKAIRDPSGRYMSRESQGALQSYMESQGLDPSEASREQQISAYNDLEDISVTTRDLTESYAIKGQIEDALATNENLRITIVGTDGVSRTYDGANYGENLDNELGRIYRAGKDRYYKD